MWLFFKNHFFKKKVLCRFGYSSSLLHKRQKQTITQCPRFFGTNEIGQTPQLTIKRKATSQTDLTLNIINNTVTNSLVVSLKLVFLLQVESSVNTNHTHSTSPKLASLLFSSVEKWRPYSTQLCPWIYQTLKGNEFELSILSLRFLFLSQVSRLNSFVTQLNISKTKRLFNFNLAFLSFCYYGVLQGGELR